MSASHPRRVLIVRFSSLGDVILTTPLLRALRRAYPALDITFATKAAYAPLLTDHPHVTRVVALAPGESVIHFARRLTPVAYDRCLDLHGSLRSLALRALLPGHWTGYSKRRLARAALIHLGLGGGPGTPVAERYFHAARGLGVRLDGGPAEVHWSPAADATARAMAPDGCVVLAPGAQHATKRWPRAHWQELAAGLVAAGHSVAVTGAAHEREPYPGGVIDMFGVQLPVAAALMARSRAVVANDSGLLHLGTAVGARVIALYGPTVPALGFGPYHADAVVLETALACRPCSARGGASCPRGHHRCLTAIAPSAVRAAIAAA
ncbi:MAG TPA: glycosyltransferase family 9 protein [Gemmatimonadales bacterium]